MGGAAVDGRSARSAQKRREIVEGARAVFARDGYGRATVDDITAEAGASTRTVYNHFPGGKSELFNAAILAGSEEVVAAELAVFSRYLDPERPPRPEDLERDLLALVRRRTALVHEHPVHFAMVRQIQAEVRHLPPDVVAAWQATGPAAAAAELARRLAAFADLGLLDLHGERPARVAAHLTHLAGTEVVTRSGYGSLPMDEGLVEEILSSGVRAFLRAYAACPRDGSVTES
ncbi:hypothetical protein BIV57_15315 [Mangrovactinospora gilvigrisea]|uniref:HTH tetR-type domain-containing protein n=1 Tax=Mangrovactinospora gilvigrisea TaxID=1428644 RepID=A0A1J7BD96_9ACTN|nr:TetR/AcrR family transcriptional regulator [Mangrovactinospora gilvigrisea]OIV36622.1 hypothetical protein BIV57_15315 [Mangrovactinospora gilvigrisea]